MNDIVNLLAAFIGLHFHQSESANRISDKIFASLTEDLQKFGTPVWEWPHLRESTFSNSSIHRSQTALGLIDKPASVEYNVVPAQALMELFLAEEGDIHKRILGSKLLKPFHAVREILLAGDTNRLVAELTFVRINDLAAPPEPLHPLVILEPFVAVLIVCNGIMIGFQTDPAWADWEGWGPMEAVFASFLVLEILTRMHLLGCRGFWWGEETSWNFFDLFLAMTGCVDIIVQQVGQMDSGIFGTSLLRFCRLIRLVRIVKVFRLKAMRDLRLMVKGLIAGIRTLILAFTLLFSVLYVISGFATMTIGSYPETKDLQLDGYFKSLPHSMFTAFRCFTGECVNNEGHSITSKMSQEYGLFFELPYVMSYMLVSMGIFNVILAVYVDITMKAAKENEAQTAEQHARESIRIARTTRELLKKFAAAYHLYQEMEENSTTDRLEIRASAALFTDDELQENIAPGQLAVPGEAVSLALL
ncbi:Voltage-dependent calcium channel type A subunit alpha-1 (Cacophony protein) [Durusdinium trenchii]|uniref:Voltage-dependent calcium channel type A subunit alpha-1 (Cacophony protein) n=1 Tax=Durusdinium trenchii TaxID=1381693 RepID=A0ABP0PKK6_9DINO